MIPLYRPSRGGSNREILKLPERIVRSKVCRWLEPSPACFTPIIADGHWDEGLFRCWDMKGRRPPLSKALEYLGLHVMLTKKEGEHEP